MPSLTLLSTRGFQDHGAFFNEPLDWEDGKAVQDFALEIDESDGRLLGGYIQLRMTRIGPETLVASFLPGKFPRGTTTAGQGVVNSINHIVHEYVVVAVEEYLDLVLFHQVVNPGLFSRVPGPRTA